MTSGPSALGVQPEKRTSDQTRNNLVLIVRQVATGASPSCLEQIVDDRIGQGVADPGWPETPIPNGQPRPREAGDEYGCDQRSGVVQMALAEECRGNDRCRAWAFHHLEQEPENDAA